MDTKKPHAVCVPYPVQSHMKAMLKLAKLLHFRGFHITFVNIDFIYERMIQSSDADSLSESPSFRFETISDGFPLSYERDADHLCVSIKRRFLSPLQDLIAKLNCDSAMDAPPVSCIVSDGFMPFSVAAAEGFGLPVALFFTISACSLMGIKQFRALEERGMLPLKDETQLKSEYLNQIIPWIIPGMGHDIRLKDLPCILHTVHPSDSLFQNLVDGVEITSKATVTIIHTFHSLEHEVLDALKSTCQLVLPIGPLQLLMTQILEKNPTGSMVGNLWKEDTECLKWLDSQPPNSVLYVNFGSIVKLNTHQFIEFAMGLASSGYHFLWVIRPNLVQGNSGVLPPEFATKTKERGLITGWCPQEEVLNHESIGGFLTHSGWNSTIESISSGVSMLCWPFVSDQYTNCRYCCVEWGVGMEINNNVTREEVARLVKELMEGAEGLIMRKRVMEFKKLAAEAATKEGSSSKSFEELVNLLSQKH